nr:hypothetical protein [Glycomyces terrestris]
MSVVPDFPATGRPASSPTTREVPHEPHCAPLRAVSVTHRPASVAARATSSSSSWWQRGEATSSSCPCGSMIRRAGIGSQYSPSAASVLNTFVISIGCTSETPSVNGPQPPRRSSEA